MKTLIMLVLLSLSFFSDVFGQLKSNDAKYIDDILDLTKDGFSVYIVLNTKMENNELSKMLITNLELHWQQYNDLDLESQFIDTLRTILNSKFWTPPKRIERLEEFIINEDIYKKLQSHHRSPKKIYKKYFDNNGVPRYDDFSDDEIKSAVAYLVENGVFVYMGKYHWYNVYVPPK